MILRRSHPADKLIVVSRQITVQNELGLHARPAAEFVRVANRFRSEITLIKDEQRFSAASLIDVLRANLDKRRQRHAGSTRRRRRGRDCASGKITGRISRPKRRLGELGASAADAPPGFRCRNCSDKDNLRVANQSPLFRSYAARKHA